MIEKKEPTKGKSEVTKGKPKKADTTKDLLTQLGYLLSVTKDVCRTLSVNMERDILEVTEYVATAVADKDGSSAIKPARLKKAELILAKLSVKPEKGRRNDLKKIEKALEEIKDLVSMGKTPEPR